jgi:hypothetical protein
MYKFLQYGEERLLLPIVTVAACIAIAISFCREISFWLDGIFFSFVVTCFVACVPGIFVYFFIQSIVEDNAPRFLVRLTQSRSMVVLSCWLSVISCVLATVDLFSGYEITRQNKWILKGRPVPGGVIKISTEIDSPSINNLWDGRIQIDFNDFMSQELLASNRVTKLQGNFPEYTAVQKTHTLVSFESRVPSDITIPDHCKISIQVKIVGGTRAFSDTECPERVSAPMGPEGGVMFVETRGIPFDLESPHLNIEMVSANSLIGKFLYWKERGNNRILYWILQCFIAGLVSFISVVIIVEEKWFREYWA